jgi:hypothetical protein
MLRFSLIRLLCFAAFFALIVPARPVWAQVNRPPVNVVPTGIQQVVENRTLTFSTANSNVISTSDLDILGGVIRVTLTATNAQLSLSSTTGLSFNSGDGTSDGIMTFEGLIPNVNNALDGLIFRPTPGYRGPASLQISTDDLGQSGSGGAQIDTDTITIDVVPVNPVVNSVNSLTSDGTYGVGQVITLTIQFNQSVIVDTTGGVPTLRLETGAVDRLAVYTGGSGSSTLTFDYTVQQGDSSFDLEYQSTAALGLNAATIRSTSNDDAILTLPTPGSAQSLSGQRSLVVNTALVHDGVISVPTLSEWGMILLSVLAAAVGMGSLRRRGVV